MTFQRVGSLQDRVESIKKVTNTANVDLKLLRLAEQGDINAKYALGKEFIANEKAAAAFDLFLNAAKQGHVPSQYELGKCYIYGIGTVQNYEQGTVWLSRAANWQDVVGYTLMNRIIDETRQAVASARTELGTAIIMVREWFSRIRKQKQCTRWQQSKEMRRQ